VAADGGETVALEVTITGELRREGLAREFVRLVQDARKSDGLDVTDRISVRWSAADTEVAEAITEHREMISREVLAVDFGAQPPGALVGAGGADAAGEDASSAVVAGAGLAEPGIAGAAKGGAAKTGAAKTGAAKTGTAESGVADAGSAIAGTAESAAEGYRHESAELGLTFWIQLATASP
jgi:hypothetical protein